MADASRETIGRFFRGRLGAVILDTGMNEDCDDSGALAVLHALADEGRAEFLGVTYCTSSRGGPPCIRTSG